MSGYVGLVLKDGVTPVDTPTPLPVTPVVGGAAVASANPLPVTGTGTYGTPATGYVSVQGGGGSGAINVVGNSGTGSTASPSPLVIGFREPLLGKVWTARGDANGVQATGNLPLGTAINASSGNVANASAVATLAAAATVTTYITGFQVTAAGATAGSVVSVTVAGVITGTMTYTFAFPAGATVAATPLIVAFPTPIQASAANTAIVVTVPAGGTGNTNATVNAQGFQL